MADFGFCKICVSDIKYSYILSECSIVRPYKSYIYTHYSYTEVIVDTLHFISYNAFSIFSQRGNMQYASFGLMDVPARRQLTIVLTAS